VIAMTQADTFAGGVVAGSSLRVHSLELQPAAIIKAHKTLVTLGLNPGVVLDREGSANHYGFQGTLWAMAILPVGDAMLLPLPFPFFRVRWIDGQPDWLAGMGLKIPLPISGW
jgi:hypothetical protein